MCALVTGVQTCALPISPQVLTAAQERAQIQLTVLRQATNGGPAPGRNAGWRAARAPVVAFIDDDCTPEPGWVAALARAFARNDRLGVAQGRTQAPDGDRKSTPLNPVTNAQLLFRLLLEIKNK